jgi:hypothetical protein
MKSSQRRSLGNSTFPLLILGFTFKPGLIAGASLSAASELGGLEPESQPTLKTAAMAMANPIKRPRRIMISPGDNRTDKGGGNQSSDQKVKLAQETRPSITSKECDGQAGPLEANGIHGDAYQ